MAALAACAELTVVHVVPEVAAAAGAGGGEGGTGTRRVAGLAGQIRMSAVEHEAGLGVVVETPELETARVVAVSAGVAEVAVVRIILPVALDALHGRVAVDLGEMALAARRQAVQTHQRKSRELVIEVNLALPADRRVAAAAGAEGSAVRIVVGMTLLARRRQRMRQLRWL
jgi:hypothetical protein